MDIRAVKDAEPLDLSLYTTHPGQEEWVIPGAYIKDTAIPMSVGIQLLAKGVKCTGVVSPDMCFEVQTFISELKRRGLIVHQRIGLLRLQS